MKQLFILCAVLLFAGCGTLKTTMSSDKKVQRALAKAETRCETLPRVYSGVSYDFCLFHAEPSTYNPELVKRSGGTFGAIRLFDFILSGALDTVLLPYSLYKQATEGNLDLNEN